VLLPSDTNRKLIMSIMAVLLTFVTYLLTPSYMASAIATRLREKPRVASLVGVAFPRAATMQTAMNGLWNSGLWPVDRSVVTDDDFAPSLVTDRPETVQLQKPTAYGTENFSLSSELKTNSRP
jgi:hypothetical protein